MQWARCSGRAKPYGQKENKQEALETLNRGRKLNTLLTMGNHVYSLFAACSTSRIPLKLTSKARFRPRRYKIPEIIFVM